MFRGDVAVGWWQQAPQLSELDVAVVDELDHRVGAQLVQDCLVGRVLWVENQCRACCDDRLPQTRLRAMLAGLSGVIRALH